MSRVRAFFLEEAAECLQAARAELARAMPQRQVVYRAVRRLRGSAELARFGGVAGQALLLEQRIRPRENDGGWSPELTALTDRGLGVLEAAVESVRAGEVEPTAEKKATMDGEAMAGGVVGVEELEYRGRAALERALELRSAIDRAIAEGGPVEATLDEIFALIRLGIE